MLLKIPTGRHLTQIIRKQFSHALHQNEAPSDQRTIFKINIDKQPDHVKPSSTLKILKDRYLISATFPDVLIKSLESFDRVPLKIYAGFDPSSNSLHIGNLIVLNALLHLFAFGFEVIILIGGGTCKLGDPSGRTVDRVPVDWQTVKRNSELIAEQIQNLFANFTKYFVIGDKQKLKPVRFVNNAKWYSDLNVIDFLDDYGRQFRVKHLLEKQAIKTRLGESGLNLNEFLYQILQAYDFLRLYDDYGCLLQFGGTDQIGNVHAGHDLVKKLRAKDALGVFSPLLTDDQGAKLGKSVGNSLSLSQSSTSPFHFYQHFMKLHDTYVQKYMYLMTCIPTADVDGICKRHMEKPEQRLGQKVLAEHLTTLIHGESGLETALKITRVLFHNNVEHLLDMTQQEIDSTFKDIPNVRLNYRPDFTALQLVSSTQRFSDDEEAELWIRRGAVYINSIQVKEPQCIMVRDCHVLKNGLTLLKFGKKKDDVYLVRWAGVA